MITNIQTHLKNFSRDTKQQLYFNALYYSAFVTQCDAETASKVLTCHFKNNKINNDYTLKFCFPS